MVKVSTPIEDSKKYYSSPSVEIQQFTIYCDSVEVSDPNGGGDNEFEF